MFYLQFRSNSTTFNILQMMGLTVNEAQAYLELISSVNLTASEITQRADIPRSKIYGVLHSLVEKGWIVKNTDRPAKFMANNPTEIIVPRQQDINKQIEQVSTELTTLWENREKIDFDVIQHLVGIDRLVEQTIAALNSARSEILFLIRFLAENEFTTILGILRRKAKSGIPVQLYLHPEVVDELSPEDLDELTQFALVRKATLPSRVLLCDSEIVLLSLPLVRDTEADTSLTQTVRITIPSMIQLLERSLRQTMNEISIDLDDKSQKSPRG